MADNKLNVGAQDRSRIAMGEDYEVAYWTEKFGVSRDELAEAVEQVGNGTEKVAVYLGKSL